MGERPELAMPIELAGLRIPDKREAIAAQSGADRFHKSENGIGGHRRIHRGAASLQHLDRRLRGQRMRSARGAVQAQRRRARGKARSRRPVTGMNVGANKVLGVRRA